MKLIKYFYSEEKGDETHKEKVSLQEVKDNLQKGKELFVGYISKKKKGPSEITWVHCWRLDSIPELKKEYSSEKYILLIERGTAEQLRRKKELKIDKRIKVSSIEEMITYLDKTKILTTEEWIQNEK